MNKVVEGKMNTPTMQLFFKAILCNWLVCLACFLPSQVKGDTAKNINDDDARFHFLLIWL